MPPAPHEQLLADALLMSVNKNLNDVTTLLLWAHDATDPATKAKHIGRAIVLLEDVHDSLTAGREETAGAADDVLVI